MMNRKKKLLLIQLFTFYIGVFIIFFFYLHLNFEKNPKNNNFIKLIKKN